MRTDLKSHASNVPVDASFGCGGGIVCRSQMEYTWTGLSSDDSFGVENAKTCSRPFVSSTPAGRVTTSVSDRIGGGPSSGNDCRSLDRTKLNAGLPEKRCKLLV